MYNMPMTDGKWEHVVVCRKRAQANERCNRLTTIAVIALPIFMVALTVIAIVLSY